MLNGQYVYSYDTGQMELRYTPYYGYGGAGSYGGGSGADSLTNDVNGSCAIGTNNIQQINRILNVYKNGNLLPVTPQKLYSNGKICGFWYCEISGGLGSNLNFTSRWNGSIPLQNNSGYYCFY